MRPALYPVLALTLFFAAAFTVDTDGGDPLATIRDQAGSGVPVAADDGVLDILIVHEASLFAVVDELEALINGEDSVALRREVFTCDGIESGMSTCRNWAEQWPALVESGDPDAIVFFVDGWTGSDLSVLAAEGDQVGIARVAIEEGFDTLSERGAPIVWASSGATFEEIFRRALSPFQQAMAEIEPSRDDVFSILSGAMPDPSVMSEIEFVERSAEALLDGAALYQRADRSDDTRVLVVGDSQARSLGYGLERWGTLNDVWVWNVAVNGCGLADEGVTFGSGTAQAVREECRGVVDDLERRVSTFDPDLVVVFSSVWDLAVRQLDGWSQPQALGDPEFDAYLEREYARAAQVLSASGARVVWIQVPCPAIPKGALSVSPGAIGDETRRHLNRTLLPAVEVQSAGVVELFDLDAILCPRDVSVQGVDGVDTIRADGIHFSVDGSAWFADTYAADLLGLKE